MISSLYSLSKECLKNKAYLLKRESTPREQFLAEIVLEIAEIVDFVIKGLLEAENNCNLL